MRGACAALALLLLPSAAGALSSGADFLRAELPARPAALAGAFAAFDDDVNAFLWNPAALARVQQPELGATHFASIIDTSFDQAAFVQAFNLLKAPGGLGLSVQHSSTGNLNETDLAGNDKGAIENGDWVLATGYAFLITPRLGLGVGLKGFSSRLAEFRSRGYAVDLGVQSRVHERLTLGLAFVELGAQEAYDQVADPLPSLLRMAAKGVVIDTKEVLINAAVELDRPWTTSDPILISLGVEYWYERTVAFRTGYRLGADSGNLSLGTGLLWNGLAFDYAYVSMGDLGLAHRFSLSAKLGTLFQKAKLLHVEVDPSLR